MRVLFITGSYPPMKCGVGDYSYNLARTLAADTKIHVGVLTSSTEREIANSDRVEIFPIMEGWGLANTLDIIKTIHHWSPDIVHIQYPTQGYGNGLLPWILPAIAFLMRKKVVQTWHEIYSRRNAPLLLLKSIIPSTLVFVRPQYVENLHPMLFWCLWNKKIVYIQNAASIPRASLHETEKSRLKNEYLKNQERLIVFFGFVHQQKGIELLFEISNPISDHIVIAGHIDEHEDYSNEIIKRASSGAWAGKVTITGSLPAHDIAALLSIADAVILPFRNGGGEWNTSIHSAVLNGAFVITTSLTKNGYDKEKNVYFSKIDNVNEMKSALKTYAGKRLEPATDIDEWEEIADKHRVLYEDILSR
jgi:glycosyltransferase involved in cell wall biosynthesis